MFIQSISNTLNLVSEAVILNKKLVLPIILQCIFVNSTTIIKPFVFLLLKEYIYKNEYSLFSNINISINIIDIVFIKIMSLN